MSWSGGAKFVSGFILAIVLLFIAGASLTHYLLALLVAPASESSAADQEAPSTVGSSAANPAATSTAPTPAGELSPSVLPSFSPLPSPSPQGYQAKVTQPIPVTVRQAASPDAAQVGIVEYNQQITVLENSPDGAWQKIRSGNIEGWVKAGNTQQIN